MDLRERLDRDLADPPHPAPDLSETVVAGRRAVRRRRAATGVAGLAAATIVGGLAWTLTPVGTESAPVVTPPADRIPVDTDPANDCHEVPATRLDACRGETVGEGAGIYYLPGQGAVRRDPGVRVRETIDNPLGIDDFNAAYEVDDNGMRLFLLVGVEGGVAVDAREAGEDFSSWLEREKDGMEVVGEPGGNGEGPAYYNSEGVLVVAEGAQIREEIPNPLRPPGEGKSLGLAVEHDGETTWLALTWTPSGQTVVSGPAQERYATLEDWVESWVAENQGGDAHVFVELTGDGTLRPLAGVEIVEQRTDVDMDPSPSARDEVAAVAELSVEGERWFVVGFGDAQSSDFQSYNTPRAGETLDEFIAYYQAQNTEGAR